MWEIKWASIQRGTHACVGVATKEAPLRKQGYQALVGGTAHSWGWDLGRNMLRHRDKPAVPVGLEQKTNENNNHHSYPAIGVSSRQLPENKIMLDVIIIYTWQVNNWSNFCFYFIIFKFEKIPQWNSLVSSIQSNAHITLNACPRTRPLWRPTGFWWRSIWTPDVLASSPMANG